MSDNLLDGLRSDGRRDSDGAFTIDFARAMEHMRTHLLADPSLYVLKLVQSAVLAGARRLDVECNDRVLRLRHDGRAPSSDQLARLLTHIVREEEGDEDVHALAVAINVAMGMAHSAVRIESGEAVLDLTAADAKLTAGLPRSDVLVEVTRPIAAWRTLFRPVPEETLLRKRATLAPLELSVNHEAVGPLPWGDRRDAPVTIADWRYVSCVIPDKHLPQKYSKRHPVLEVRYLADRHGTVGLHPNSTASHVCNAEWSASVSLPPVHGPMRSEPCRAVLRLLAEPRTRTVVTLVSQGVIVGHIDRHLPPGFQGAIAVDGLTDLSGLTLHDDARTQIALEVEANIRRIQALAAATWAGDSIFHQVGHALSGVPGAHVVGLVEVAKEFTEN